MDSPEVEPPGSQHRHPVPRVVALVAAVLAAVLAAGVVTHLRRSSPAAALPASPSPSVSGSGSLQQQVRARVPELQAFVERERGLRFRRPVQVDVLKDRAFLRVLHADEVPVGAGEDQDASFSALGLLPVEEDFEQSIDDEIDDTVGGYYDFSTRRVSLRADLRAPLREAVLVHELTHALQAQHFLLSRQPRGDADETYTALTALIEGDATRVDQAWYAAQPPDVQVRLRRQGGYGVAPVLSSDLVPALLDFPYVAGPPLVQGLLDEGGQARLDHAFEMPPLTTAQVLHPERIAEGAPLALATPPGRGRQVDEGVLGELGLALLLRRDPLRGGPQENWVADRYATYRSGGRTCTVADLEVVRSGGEALVQALRDAGLQAETLRPTRVRLSRCA